MSADLGPLPEPVRAAFEAWVPTYHTITNPGPLTRLDGNGRYFYGPVNASWAAWQAAHAQGYAAGLVAERERIRSILLGMDDAAGDRHNYYGHAAWVLFREGESAAPMSEGVAAGVPAGWKLVPLEATRSMCAAAVIDVNGPAVYKSVAAVALEIEETIYGEAYKAMLAASPTPPAEPAEPQKPVAEFCEFRGRPMLLPGAPLLTHKQPLYAAPPQAAQPPAEWVQKVCRYISDTLANGTAKEQTVARTIMLLLPLDALTAPQAAQPPQPVQAQAAEPAPVGGPRVVAEVLAELERATRKFPTWPTDPLHALAVLGEEFGELTKAMLQFTYEPHKNVTRMDIRSEAIQTAAMSLRLAMSLPLYDYAPAPQHKQGGIGPAPAKDATAQHPTLKD